MSDEHVVLDAPEQPISGGRSRFHRLKGARSKFVTGLVVVLGLGALAGGTAILVGGYNLNTVTSGSMRPGIQPGDLVVLQRVNATTLKVGDVIAYVPPNGAEPLLHRIVTLSSSAGVLVETQGDANNTLDSGPVRLDATAFRLAGSVPFLGWLIVLRSWIWLAFGAALVLLALAWLRGVVGARLRR
jgi:signal peptidase I